MIENALNHNLTRPNHDNVFSRVAGLPDWALLAAFAGLLRFINLGSESVWYDEAFTALVARTPLPNLMTAIRGDVHPPLFYLLEWINVRVFGASEFALRLPNALLGILAVILIWRLALRLGFDRPTALIAGLLASVLPSMLYYSQDARMYPLLVCCVLTAILAALQARWSLFFFAGVGMVYTQNLGVLYIGVIGLAVLFIQWRIRDDLARPFAMLVCIVLAWLPWLIWGLLYQIHDMSKGFWLPPLTPGAAILPIIGVTMMNRMADGFQFHVYVGAVLISMIGLISSRAWLRTYKGFLILAGLLGVPILALVASLVWRNVYLPRAFLPSASLLMLVWAYALTHLSRPNQAAARLILIPALCIGLVAHYFPDQGRDNVKGWLYSVVGRAWQPGDVFYHIAIESMVLSNYYMPTAPYKLFPQSSDLSQSLTDETKTALQLDQGRFDDLAMQGFKRAWLIASFTPLASKAELDETDRILHKYHAVLVGSRGKTLAETAVYLVELQ